jgi:hypothetical protein
MSAMVDIDLLADYIGGALDGTPQEPKVRELISTDPAWRQAAADLTLALDLVAIDLQVTAAAPDPMPADLITRFDELLAGPQFAAAAGPAARSGVGERVVPRAKARRRRLARWGGPIVIAAGIATVVGGALLTGQSNESSPLADAPANEQTWNADIGVPTVASGANFTREQVSNTAANAALQSTPGVAPRLTLDAAEGTLDPSVPAELTALRAEPRLARCLELVTAQVPGAVRLVDFARFEDAPALIIAISAADDDWAFVAGADCGVTDTDELYRVRVP